jgi:hypothetical protein
MKTFLVSLLVASIVLIKPEGSLAQTCPVATDFAGGVTYGLRITSTSPAVIYEAYLVTNGSGCRTVGSSQFSVVVGSTTTVTTVDGNPSGVFNNPWGFNSNATTGGNRYYAAATTGSGQRITFTAGQQLPLFTFTLGGTCSGGVRIFRNVTDATGPADPGDVQGGDFSNNFFLAVSPSPVIPSREAYLQNESSFRDCPAVILPITLTNFSAHAVSNKQVLLSWETLNETNTNQFVVERSNKPAVSNTWQVVGTLAAAGTVAGSRSYQLNDTKPYNGPNYYRLRTIDRDGKEITSSIKQVNFNANSVLAASVYPNPVLHGGAVTITVAETVRYRLLDKTGRLISGGTFAAGNSKLIAPSVAGAYLLEISGVQNGSSKEHYRIIVQ